MAYASSKPSLSKSRLVSAERCMKKLWLGVHEPSAAYNSSQALLAMKGGDDVGEIIKTIYATEDSIEIALQKDRQAMVKETTDLLASGARFPIFEATFEHKNVLVRIDVLLPDGDGWRAVEIKSSKRTKPEHDIDCAAQWWVMKHAGLKINAIALGHVSEDFVYSGNENYDGLITEVDFTEKVIKLQPRVEELVEEGSKVLAASKPEVLLGKQCTSPHDCEFYRECFPMDEPYPVQGLKGNKENIANWINRGFTDLRKVPESEVTEKRPKRVYRVTRSGEAEVIPGAKEKLEALGYPQYHLDFESIGPAVPLWKGLKAHYAVPVQYSIHIDDGTGVPLDTMPHEEFLELSREPPMRDLAIRLIKDLRDKGPVFMYTTYERQMINKLIDLFPDLEDKLQPIVARLVDLKKIVYEHYYHPDMLGSWSVKDVVPAMVPGMSYEKLEGIKNGAMAVDGYLEAIDPKTSPDRKAELEEQLLRYCRFDTEAMVEIARYLSTS